MPEPSTTGVKARCPEIEMLGAYVDGTLDDRARGEVEAHVADCEECYELVAELVRSQEHAAQPAPRPRTVPFKPRRRVIVAAIAGLGVAAAVMLAVRLIGPASSRRGAADDQISKLVAAAGTERMVGRFAGGFEYGPLQSTRGSGNATSNLSLLVAAAELQKAVDANPTPENLHAFGVAQVLLGNFDVGIRYLSDALADGPGVAQFQSDLSAAYVASASARDVAGHWPLALAAAEAALKIDNTLPEARFNRAIALEGLHLETDAATAWRSYLEVDSTSQWAEEARQRLQRLTQPQSSRWENDYQALAAAADQLQFATGLTRTNPQLVREWIELEVWPQWSRAVASRDPAVAAKTLATIERVGEALAATQQDQLVRGGVLAVRRAGQTTDDLVTAHLELARGRELYLATRYADTVPPFENAKRLFIKHRSPYAAWADFHLAAAPYFASRLDESRRRLEALLELGLDTLPNIQGRAHWLLGLIAVGQGRYTEALQHYERMTSIFDASKESEGRAHAHNLLAEALRDIGDESWWRHQLTALSLRWALRPQRRHAIHINATQGAIEEGLIDVAAHFQGATLANARDNGTPSSIAEAYQWMFVVRTRQGDHGAAAELYREALAWAAQVQDPGLKQRIDAELASLEAEVALDGDPSRAASAARHALTFFEKEGRFRRTPWITLRAARAEVQQQNWTAAERELRHGLAAAKAQRSRLATSTLRASFYQERWELAEELVRTHLQQDPSGVAALASLEAVRSVQRLRSIDRNELELFARQLPERMAVVQYLPLDDEVLIWLLRRDGIRLLREPIARPALGRLITRYAQAIFDGAAAPRLSAFSAPLYQRLISPIASLVEPGSTIVVVADGILGGLPFAAIVDPATSRYLAQTFAMAHAERILAENDTPSRADSIRTALVVANDTGTFQGRRLPNLPLAISEAREVAGLYGNAETLIGPDATVARFRAGLQHAEIVHVAAHAVSVPSVPDRSLVVLRTGQGEEELTARAIETSTPTRAEVVVLAACRSALSRTYAGQGAIGIASAFLRAGARRVIGSLWEVDDGTTRDLMIRFHRALAAGVSPLVALSTAQRGLLESGADTHHPRHWGAWIMLSRDVATAVQGLPPVVSPSQS